MDSKEINDLIACFDGRVLALNEIPSSRVSAPFMCVYNSEPRPSGGKHWLGLACIERDGRRSIYHLDSLGLMPCLEPVVNFINNNYDGFLYCNNRPLQSPSSITCGYYAVLMLHWLESGGDFNAFLGEFSSTPEENDRKIIGLFARLGLEQASVTCEAISRLATEQQHALPGERV
jgi:hypothetical protein